MFSKACEYSIRALVFIAQKSQKGERLGIKEIATGVDSPEPFMGKLLTELSRKGLVLSIKGPHGGFYMDEKCLKSTFADVVTAIDGNQLFTGCGLGLRYAMNTSLVPFMTSLKLFETN